MHGIAPDHRPITLAVTRLRRPIPTYISRAISHADLGLNSRPVASFDRKGRGAHGSAADQPENE